MFKWQHASIQKAECSWTSVLHSHKHVSTPHTHSNERANNEWSGKQKELDCRTQPHMKESWKVLFRQRTELKVRIQWCIWYEKKARQITGTRNQSFKVIVDHWHHRVQSNQHLQINLSEFSLSVFLSVDLCFGGRVVGLFNRLVF